MVKVAAVQMDVSDDVHTNLARMVERIGEASSQGADFICFPECCLVPDIAELRPIGRDLLKLKQAARDNGVCVIFGTYIIEKEKVRNQIIVITPEGKMASRYNKRHPYVTERGEIAPGRRNRVVEVGGLRFAVIDCWDYAFPEQLRNLARRGAQVIFCPSYLVSHPKTSEVLAKIPQVRAFDCMAYFIMVDAYERETFQRTRICHPLRELASIEGEPGTIYAELDIGEIAELRTTFDNLQ